MVLTIVSFLVLILGRTESYFDKNIVIVLDSEIQNLSWPQQ